MDLLTVTAFAIGLSFDTFAVSLSYGVIQNGIMFRQALRIASIFAFFQAGFFVAGFYMGSLISLVVKAADHWFALALLSFLGIKMIIGGLKRGENDKNKKYCGLASLFAVAVGTSIDAFAVGISFAFISVKIWFSWVVIGVVTFLASMTAIRIGKSAGIILGRGAEIMGGIILLSIGIKIFLEHIL